MMLRSWFLSCFCRHEKIKGFSCRQLGTATSLADVSVAWMLQLSHPGDSWSIQPKHRQEKLQYQVVYKRTLLSFQAWCCSLCSHSNDFILYSDVQPLLCLCSVSTSKKCTWFYTWKVGKERIEVAIESFSFLPTYYMLCACTHTHKPIL